MELNEGLNYFVFTSELCVLLFIRFGFYTLRLDEKTMFLTWVVSGVLSAAGLALNVDKSAKGIWNYELNIFNGVYSMALGKALMNLALIVIQAIRSGHVKILLANYQPNISSPDEGAPEKKLTTFAITMGILDMTASGLALLKCSLGVWNTQLVMVKSITVLTLILEGIRISCRSLGLELHHMHNMQQLSLSIHSFSCAFYWLHLISVLASGVVSAMGLASHDFSKQEEALVFIYVVAILEALVFLAEKAFWEWKVRICKLLENVKDECGLETSEMDSIKRFLYDAYYKCMTGKIFEVPKMNLVIFAEELLVSTLAEEQFMGTRILMKLLEHPGLSYATLGKILTSTDSKVIARLIQMLNESNFFEEKIIYSAAEIVFKLANKAPNMKQYHMEGMKEAIKSAHDLLGHK